MQPDLRIHDSVALDEIELYTDVLTAVAAADGPLTEAELDQVLGIGVPGSASRSASVLVHHIELSFPEAEPAV